MASAKQQLTRNIHSSFDLHFSFVIYFRPCIVATSKKALACTRKSCSSFVALSWKRPKLESRGLIFYMVDIGCKMHWLLRHNKYPAYSVTLKLHAEASMTYLCFKMLWLWCFDVARTDSPWQLKHPEKELKNAQHAHTHKYPEKTTRIYTNNCKFSL